MIKGLGESLPKVEFDDIGFVVSEGYDTEKMWKERSQEEGKWNVKYETTGKVIVVYLGATMWLNLESDDPYCGVEASFEVKQFLGEERHYGENYLVFDVGWNRKDEIIRMIAEDDIENIRLESRSVGKWEPTEDEPQESEYRNIIEMWQTTGNKLREKWYRARKYPESK